MATAETSSGDERSLAVLKTATDATLSLLHSCLELVSTIVKSHPNGDAARLPPSPSFSSASSSAFTVSSRPDPAPIPPESYTDPLTTAHSAALLVRANSTKLGLLLLNAPFTPSAIVTVLKELGGGAIPTLAAAAEQLAGVDQQRKPDQEKPRYHYTELVRQEVARASWRVLEQLRLLLAEIPLSKFPTAAQQAAKKNAVTSSTGLLWAACDRLSELSRPGGVGPKEFLIKTVEGYAAVMKDTLEELKEWGEEESDSGDESDDDQLATESAGSAGTSLPSAPSKHDAAQSLVDALFSNQKHIPSSDPAQLRPRLELTTKRLRLCTLLCAAVIKRRIKPLPVIKPSTSAAAAAIPWPAHEPTTARLDAGLAALAQTRDAFDECAAALYELDPVAVDSALEVAFVRAFSAAQVWARAWDWDVVPNNGAKNDWVERDEFSVWADKFQTSIGQA